MHNPKDSAQSWRRLGAQVSGRKTPEVDEEQVKDLHAKIGELAVTNDFLARKLKP